MQTNLIFNDNVRILCLSCNVKKSKTTGKLSENSWNKRRSNLFQMCHLWRRGYTVTVSFCYYKWIRYQKCFSVLTNLMIILFLAIMVRILILSMNLHILVLFSLQMVLFVRIKRNWSVKLEKPCIVFLKKVENYVCQLTYRLRCLAQWLSH